MKDWEAVPELLLVTYIRHREADAKEIVSGFWLTFFVPLKYDL